MKYLLVILKYKKLVFFLAIFTATAATIGGLLKSPVYEANTTVVMKSTLLQPQIYPMQTGFSGTIVENTTTKAETFQNIIKSRAVVENVVEYLDLINDGKSANKQPASLLVTKLKNLVNEIFRFLIYGNKVKQKTDPKESLILKTQKAINAKLIPKSSAMEIAVRHKNASRSAEIANSVADEFVKFMLDMNTAEARQMRDFLTKRVSEAETEVTKAQNKLLSFIKNESLANPERRMNLLLSELVNFQSSVKNTEAEIDELRTRLEENRRQLAKFDEKLKSSSTTVLNPIIMELESQLIKLESRRVELSVDHGPMHPKMLSLEKEIEQTKANLNNRASRIVQSEVVTDNPVYQKILTELLTNQAKLKSTDAKKDALEKIVKSFSQKLLFTAEKQTAWDNLSFAEKFAYKNLELLKAELEKARITEVQKISEIKVVDRAIPPHSPIGLPFIGYTLLGFLVGFTAGTGLAFFAEYMYDSIEGVEEVEEYLGFPVYAVIPEIETMKTRHLERLINNRSFSNRKNNLVSLFAPKSIVAEAYRSFRTNVQFAGGKGGKAKILLFTSALVGEGKSTTISNLAISMAQVGKKTLLVDCDMRKPQLHSLFEIASDPGLSNFLANSTDFKQIVNPSGIRNLDLIPVGSLPPNPAELLNSLRFDELLKKGMEEYDLVLLDSPPIMAVTDATVLSSKVDGVFLVIKAGMTNKKACIRSKMLMEKVGANIFGIVLNRVKAGGGFGYNNYYYQSNTDEGENRNKKVNGNNHCKKDQENPM